MSNDNNNNEVLDKINDLTVAESNNSKDIGYIKSDTQDIKNSITVLSKRVEDFYVSQDQFYPVKTAVYGLMGGILITVLIAILSLVIIPQVLAPVNSQNEMINSHMSGREKAK